MDDSATPEEIMKKFEALEEIQKKKAETSSLVSTISICIITRIVTHQMKMVVMQTHFLMKMSRKWYYVLIYSGVLDDDDLRELLNRIGTVLDDDSLEDE